MTLLPSQLLDKILASAVELGLAGKRSMLLAGIDPTAVARLETNPVPFDQLKLDLTAMNGITRAVGPGIPLQMWLESAAESLSARVEGAFFAECAAQIRPQREPSSDQAAEGARSTIAFLGSLAKDDSAFANALKEAGRELESIAAELNPLSVHKRIHDLLHEYQLDSLPMIHSALEGAWTEPGIYREILSSTVDRFKRVIAGGRAEIENLEAESFEKRQQARCLEALEAAQADLDLAIGSGSPTQVYGALIDFRREMWRQMTELNVYMSRRADDLKIDRLVGHLRALAGMFPELDDERAVQLRTAATQLSVLDIEIEKLILEHDRWQRLDDEIWAAEDDFLYREESDRALGAFAKRWPRVVALVVEIAGPSPPAWYGCTEDCVKKFAENCPFPVVRPIATMAREQFRGFVKSARTQFHTIDLELVSRCNRLSALTEPLEHWARTL